MYGAEWSSYIVGEAIPIYLKGASIGHSIIKTPLHKNYITADIYLEVDPETLKMGHFVIGIHSSCGEGTFKCIRVVSKEYLTNYNLSHAAVNILDLIARSKLMEFLK